MDLPAIFFFMDPRSDFSFISVFLPYICGSIAGSILRFMIVGHFQTNRRISCHYVLIWRFRMFSNNCIFQKCRLIIWKCKFVIFFFRHHTICCIHDRCRVIILIYAGFFTFLNQSISRYIRIWYDIAYSHHPAKYRILRYRLHHHIPKRFFQSECLLTKCLIFRIVCRWIDWSNILPRIPDPV